MPRKRLSMHKIKELLRLKFALNLSTRQISSSLAISVGSTQDYLARARIAGISWPMCEEISDQDIEDLLFPSSSGSKIDHKPLPDWHLIECALKQKGVTLRLLWEEYRLIYSNGLGYSHFCKHYCDFKQTIDPRMRQSHKAGEKLFVDYSGVTLPLTNRTTGAISNVQVFVATMGASSYTYAEAILTQSIPDWISSHIRAFEFFGGVPQILVCDNLRSGVTHSCLYEPNIQRTYEELGRHYSIAIVPARVRKPRDKAKVEAGVQRIEQRVLARLRNRQFFSVSDMNRAIKPLLEEMNRQPMQGFEHSRLDLFEQLDKPVLRSLPLHRYEIGIWSHARVGTDYHITFDNCHYSVPYYLNSQQVDVRASRNVIEIFYMNERVTSHVRITDKLGCSTLQEHMPEKHKAYSDWTNERMHAWLQEQGGSILSVGEAIFAEQLHPLQAVRSCIGLVRLSENYGSDRLEAACKRALEMSSPCYSTIKAILEKGMDRTSSKELVKEPFQHHNIRGAEYYTSTDLVITETSRDA